VITAEQGEQRDEGVMMSLVPSLLLCRYWLVMPLSVTVRLEAAESRANNWYQGG
jgi:hypothetical protein